MVDLVLPLREVTLEGSTSHEGDCIGERTNDFEPSEWESGGLLHAKLTVSEAMAADLGPCVDLTLCDLLSGLERDGCSELGLGATDTELDGEPAWTVEATFAAVGVVIGEPR